MVKELRILTIRSLFYSSLLRQGLACLRYKFRE
jgi:hypothetical protein